MCPRYCLSWDLSAILHLSPSHFQRHWEVVTNLSYTSLWSTELARVHVGYSLSRECLMSVFGKMHTKVTSVHAFLGLPFNPHVFASSMPWAVSGITGTKSNVYNSL